MFFFMAQQQKYLIPRSPFSLSFLALPSSRLPPQLQLLPPLRLIPTHVLYVALCVVDPLIFSNIPSNTSKLYSEMSETEFVHPVSPRRIKLGNPGPLSASSPLPIYPLETHGTFCLRQRPLLLRIDDADSISLQCQSSWYHRPQCCRWYGPFLWWSCSTPCWHVGVCHWQHLWRNRQVS